MRQYRAALRQLVFSWETRPIAFCQALGMVCIGATTAFLGEGASRAFTIVGGGDLLPMIFGFFMCLGGLLVLRGCCLHHTATELAGWVFVCAGSAMYSTGVIVGLHWNGVVAAGGYAFLALGALSRVVLTVRDARRLARMDTS